MTNRTQRNRTVGRWCGRIKWIGGILALAVLAFPVSSVAAPPPSSGVSGASAARVGWLQSRFGSAHNADNLDETILSVANAGQLQQHWSTPVSRADWVLEDNPTVDGGVVYLATWDGHLLAVAATTGHVLWSRNLPAGTFGTSPLTSSRIFTWLADGTLRAYLRRNGAQIWSVAEPNGGGVPDDSITLSDHVIYGASLTGDVWARRTWNGAQVWRTHVSSGNFGSAVVWNNEVLVITNDDTVVALNKDTGKVLWRTTVNGVNSSDPPVVGANGLLFLSGDGDCSLTALNATTGALRWRNLLYKPCNFSAAGYVAVDATHAYLATSNDDVLEIDAATGHVVWKTHLPGVAFAAGYWSRPVLADGVLWITGSDELWALDAASGRKMLAAPTTGAFGEPVVWDGWVYTAEADDALHAYTIGDTTPAATG
jgi:outer membrane protein assembly factor BamB